MRFLLVCTIQSSLILLLAAFCLRLLRGSSAAVRHCVLSGAVIFAVLTPVLNLVAPSWKLEVLPATQLVPRSVKQTSPAPMPPAAISRESVKPPAEFTVSGWLRERLAIRGSLPWALWLTGVAFGLGALVTGFGRLAKLAASSKPMPKGRWTRLAATISSEYGIRSLVQLLESRNPSVLVTWGAKQAKVILPSGANEWPEERARIVLRHELAHVRRRDWIVQMFAQSLRIIYWFNPLVWIVCNRLRLESECACDDAVLSRDVDGSDYAEHLLEPARVLNNPTQAWSAALTMACPNTIERRFAAMLDPQVNRRPVTGIIVLATLFAGICITLPLAAVTLSPVSRVVPVIQPAPIAPPPQAPSAPRDIEPQRLEPAKQVGQVVLQLAPPAIQLGRPESLEIVLGVKRPLDVGLYEAAESGDVSDLDTLIRAGANINGVVPGDGTPLIGAARRGRFEIVQALLDRGADPNIYAPGDGNALIVAGSSGHAQVVKLLLDRGARVDEPAPGDGSPLIAAAARGRVEIVAMLLERGATIDMVVPGDENALISASASGQLAVVKLLVSRRADVNARVWVEATAWRPGEWRTPLSMAKKHGHQAVVDYLISVGARE